MLRVAADKPEVYSLFEPDSLASATIFSSPHSGAEYPKDLMMRSHLDKMALRSSEDAYVDELFAAAPLCGAPLLAARFPRAWIDLNRAASCMAKSRYQRRSDALRPATAPIMRHLIS